MSARVTQPDVCIVCIASRQRAVDAFLTGYVVGLKELATTGMLGSDMSRIKEPVTCLLHTKDITMAFAQVVREVTP